MSSFKSQKLYNYIVSCKDNFEKKIINLNQIYYYQLSYFFLILIN